MAGSSTPVANDPWRWLAVNEERLMLHDGLVIMSDHIAVPNGVAELTSYDSGLPVLDGKNPEELSAILLKECKAKTTSYASLIEYRLNALKGLWKSLRDLEESHETNIAKEINSSSKQSSSPNVSFASRVSLVLIFPLIKSLSRLDSTLSSDMATVLLESLRACEPLSLSSEPSDCINGLENLLCSWLQNAQESTEDSPVNINEVQNAASALVALAVAVGTGSLLLRTVHLLQMLKESHSNLNLLVPGILHKLLQDHLSHDGPSGLTADSHTLCWGYNDGLLQETKDSAGPRSIAFDGKFIYITSTSLRYLLKLGSGKNGTIKGMVYTHQEQENGWVLCASGQLLHCKVTEDNNQSNLTVSSLNKETLNVISEVPVQGEIPTDILQTFQFMSDGKDMFWLYGIQTQETLTNPISGDKIKQHPVYLHTIHIKEREELTLVLGSRVLVQRCEQESDKNAGMLKALVRANPSYSASALSSLLGFKDKDDSSASTSTGLSVNMLQKSVGYITGSSVVLICPPPSSGGGRGNMFGIQSNHAPKCLCLSVCYNVLTGKSMPQMELQPAGQLRCAMTSKGASITTMAACYDSSNHCIWTCNDDWIDIWDCAGKVRIANHQLVTRLGKENLEDLIPSSTSTGSTSSEASSPTISVSEAIGLMLRHIGIESCRLVPEFSTTIMHNLPLAFLQQCCDLLECSIQEKNWSNTQAIIITLQAVLPSFLSDRRVSEDKLLPLRDRVRKLVWHLLTECPLDHSHPLLLECRRIVSRNAEALFLSHLEDTDLIATLLNAVQGKDLTLCALREEMLMQMAHDLQHCSSLSSALTSVSRLVKANLVEDSLQVIKKCNEASQEQLPQIIACSPVFPPTLQCGAMLLNVTLRRLVSCLYHKNNREERKDGVEEEDKDDSKSHEATSATSIVPSHDWAKELDEARSDLLRMCDSLELFAACEATLQELGAMPVASAAELEGAGPSSTTTLASFPPSSSTVSNDSTGLPPPPSSHQLRVQAVERCARGSVLGSMLPPLLATLSDPELCTLHMATSLQDRLSHLTNLAAKACCALYGEQGDTGTIKIPAPWAAGRTVETIHPVRDNYKFKETVSFPGATNLYLKFDPRCSSQYDYDKVIVYAGESTSSLKVVEYGGNTHGFGSRSVLGKGWPKDLVRVDKDTVTFQFEMKSGREHSTPDKAMWGFACTVRPQETTDCSPAGLPFLIDIYLSLASVCCSMTSQLYRGPPPSPEEETCKELLKSELLQCCVWPSQEDSSSSDGSTFLEKKSPCRQVTVPHINLPPKVLLQLRSFANKRRPTLRPSIQLVLKVDQLEDLILSVCLKHHGAISAIQLLASQDQIKDKEKMAGWSDLMGQIFGRVNSLERRLQHIAELESSWWNDVEDLVAGNISSVSDCFFYGLLQREGSKKNLELLCRVKGVDVVHNDLLGTVRILHEKMEADVMEWNTSKEKNVNRTPVTQGLVKGILDRSNLLLNVTIVQPPSLSESDSGLIIKDDSTVWKQPAPSLGRSVSLPPISMDMSVRRSRSGIRERLSSLLELPAAVDKSNLLDQIFQFIGNKPEEAVDCASFLKAAEQHHRRGKCRVAALNYLHSLLTSDYSGLAVKQLLASVGVVLQNGPGIRDVACGGMADKVREVFATVMHDVVELASKQPAICIDTITLLSIIPYTRSEEQCLVRSGLVKLLDRLCSLVDDQKSLDDLKGTEDEDSLHRVTSMAWAAFQVLADHCVAWESEDSAVLSSGLAKQVSMLLTNHLSRAMDHLVVSEGSASEALQDALSLLLGLAKSHLGRTILSQPACISKLLLILTDQRPSPKLVLIALQLCRIALPLMTVADCSLVDIPMRQSHQSSPSSSPSSNKIIGKRLAADIVNLLLAKLAEYIVPDASEVSHDQLQEEYLSPEERDHSHHSHQPVHFHHDPVLDSENGMASVYIYKREGDTTAEILQPLLSQDPRHFRLGQHMHEVMQIDKALTDHGKAEVVTDSYRSCIRRALRWASMGFTVSVESPSEAIGAEPTSGAVTDKKRAHAEAAAKKKNQELFKSDPPRPFLNGQVAYSLASEVIGLIHGLLTESSAADVWGTAIKDAILHSLHSIPSLVPRLMAYTMEVHSCVATGTKPSPPDNLLNSACIANATFAVLGGFQEALRPGMRVQVVGGTVEMCFGTIRSMAERKGIAIVRMEDDPLCFGPDKTLEVPLSRIRPPKRDTMLPLKQLGVGLQLCTAICSVLNSTGPSLTHAHSSLDANTIPLGLCRLFAELRTRACMCLAEHVIDPAMAELFLSQTSSGEDQPSPRELLTQEAERCNCGLRVSLVATQCQSLRMLYRDCARPPPPRPSIITTKPKQMHLDVCRSWPPVIACSFTEQLTCVTFQGSSSMSAPAQQSGDDNSAPVRPKGVVIYATSCVAMQAPSFYWELEVCHLGGEGSTDLAMGYSPDPPVQQEGEQAQTWIYPKHTVLMRNNGRACQVNGDNTLEWNKFRLRHSIKTGDYVGCGWIKTSAEGEPSLGNVYFTRNGERCANEFTAVPGGMFPFLHIQKKSTRVKVNFGDSPFRYLEGHAHRDAADLLEEVESSEAVAMLFAELPFALEDTESDEDRDRDKMATDSDREEGVVVELSQMGPPTRRLKTPMPTIGYDSETSQGYHKIKSFESMLESGPLIRPGGGVQEEEEEEEGSGSAQEEDVHLLLVKAWEAKVFPVIQKRFRNDHERKSGLEQIKGALQLGMETIAQETVEFLYEENGGIPRDLHLPTMDDVKADLGKFTINRVKKGSVVVVQKDLPYVRCGGRMMQKTQGLTGTVLDVDEHTETVQVECYLQNEGALVRFWYPVMSLERPPPGYRKASSLRSADAANMMVHRQLLKCESNLVSMYCRQALLRVQVITNQREQELMDRLLLVSEQCFAEALLEGVTTTTNPDLAPSPSVPLAPLVLSPLPLFYSDIETISREIQQLISRKKKAGCLLGLTQSLCQTFLTTPQDFAVMELKITEAKEVIDIVHPDAAFLLVSCLDDKAATSKTSSSSYKYPWARVMCYQGGQGKGGRQQLQEVARYPSQLNQPSASLQYCGPKYPALCLPCNRIHVKLGGCSTRPGKLLHVLSLPKEFPLALSFIHCLTEGLAGKANRLSCCSSDSALSSVISSDELQSMLVSLEGLCKFFCRMDCLIPLKELVLHLLSDVIWTLCSVPWPHPDWEASDIKLYTFPSKFLQSAQEELLKVYDGEVADISKGKGSKSTFPPPETIGAGGLGRFSTYFQALLEFVLASFHYQNHFHGIDLHPSSESTASASSSSSSVQSSLATPSHTSASGLSSSSGTSVSRSPGNAGFFDSPLAKKLSKRPRHRKGNKKDNADSSVKKEEWLHTVRKAGSLLRSVAMSRVSPQSLEDLTKKDERYLLPLPQQHPCSRLVVLCGISPSVTGEDADSSIRKVCKLYGGLYMDEVFRNFEGKVEEAGSSEKDEHSCVKSGEGAGEKVSSGLGRAAILELRSSSCTSAVCSALLASQALQESQDKPCAGEACTLQALGVTNSFSCGEPETKANSVLLDFLRSRLTSSSEKGRLSSPAINALCRIFKSDLQDSSDSIAATQVTGSLSQMMSSIAEMGDLTLETLKEEIWKKHADDKGQLSCDGFVKYIEGCVFGGGKESGPKLLRGVWQGLLDCGYDLHLQEYLVDCPDQVHSSFTTSQDTALVHYLDGLCQNLSVEASAIQTWDICITEEDTVSQELTALQGLSLKDIRHRFFQLKIINHQVSMLLPLVDLRSNHPLSLGQLISSLSHLLFYDVKISFLHSVLNAATRRSLDQAPPEIKMDPLEAVEGVVSEPHKTQMCQAAQQMLSVPSPRLCVALASGGDPTYAFNVRLSGEEVLGTSGSFRHFLWHVVRELQSSALSLLLHCPSNSVGINQGKFILAPGPISYAEEKLLQFFGQLLGVSVRAGVHIALDFLPCFWKSLKGEPLTIDDLKEADYVTYKLTSDILNSSTPEELQEILGFQGRARLPMAEEEVDYSSCTGLARKVFFTYVDLNGSVVELVSGGKEVEVEFSNRKEYAEAVRQSRLKELACGSLMSVIKCGLASVIPLQLLSVLTSQDLALRVCGKPDINLEYLKRHTMYQVGLMETDKHVQYFWNALESFSQDELRKFIKFACNQERIPFGLPCRDGQDADMNVPPYPMKIAPPDGRGPPDSRYIRAETCMFMVKLPQYSSQQVMTERLRYAIHCREDPLSG